MREVLIAVAWFTAVAGCGNRANVQCDVDVNCDLNSGGVCTSNAVGDRWCAYPDPACPNGYRYSDQAVGDGASGQCVVEEVDAGIGNFPDWVVRHGGSANDYGRGIAAAPNGDLVIVGRSENTVSLGGAALASGGWVVRYKPDGSHVWSRSIADGGAEGVVAAIDPMGDVYVAGDWGGSVNFGGGVRTSSPYSNSKFVVKLAGATGDYIWDHVVIGAGSQFELFAIAFTGGRVAICGDFRDTEDFGGGTRMAGGGLDDYIAVYNSASGSHVWSSALTTTGEDGGGCDLVTKDDDFIVIGGFQGTATLGGAPLVATGSSDMYMARYHGSDGGHVWSVRHGGPGMAYVTPLKLASDGTHIIAGGFFVSNVNLGGNDLNVPSPTSGDAFLASYDPDDGAHLWSESFGSEDGAVDAIAASPDRLTIAIGFTKSLMLGTTTFTPSADHRDVVFTRINAATGSLGTAAAQVDGLIGLSLLYTAGRLAGVGSFIGMTQLDGSTLVSLGAADVMSFRVDF